MVGGVLTDALPKLSWLFAFSDDKTEWIVRSWGIYGFDNPVVMVCFYLIFPRVSGENDARGRTLPTVYCLRCTRCSMHVLHSLGYRIIQNSPGPLGHARIKALSVDEINCYICWCCVVVQYTINNILYRSNADYNISQLQHILFPMQRAIHLPHVEYSTE